MKRSRFRNQHIQTEIITIRRCWLAYLSVGITDQDHLLKQLAIRGCFGNNFPEHQQELFDGVVLKRQHKTNYGHQQSRELLAIQDHDDDLLQGFGLCLDLPLFCKRISVIILTTTLNGISQGSRMHWEQYCEEKLAILLSFF